MLPSITELIKQSVEEAKKHWKSLIKYPLVIVLAYVAIVILGIIVAAVVGFSAVSQMVVSENLNNIGGIWTTVGTSVVVGVVLAIALFVLIMVLFTAIQIAYIRTVDKLLSGGTALGVFVEIGQSRGIIWRTIGSQLLVGLAAGWPYLIGAGLMLFAMPAVFTGGSAQSGAMFGLAVLIMIYGFFHAMYFGVLYSFSQFQVALKGEKVVQSLRASKALVKGRWWAIFGRMFVPGLLLVLPYYILVGIGSAMENIVGGILVILGIIYIMFFVVILMPLLFVKLFRAADVSPVPQNPPTATNPAT